MHNLHEPFAPASQAIWTKAKKKKHTKTKQKCVKRQHCEAFWQNDLSSQPEGHRLVTAVPEHAMLNNPDKSTRGLWRNYFIAKYQVIFHGGCIHRWPAGWQCGIPELCAASLIITSHKLQSRVTRTFFWFVHVIKCSMHNSHCVSRSEKRWQKHSAWMKLCYFCFKAICNYFKASDLRPSMYSLYRYFLDSHVIGCWCYYLFWITDLQRLQKHVCPGHYTVLGLALLKMQFMPLVLLRPGRRRSGETEQKHTKSLKLSTSYN